MRRLAVAIAVPSAAPRDSRSFAALEFATGLTDALVARLSDAPFAFDASAEHGPSAREIEERVAALLSTEAESRVVHFIGHAMHSENDVHLVGNDGFFTRPINDWTREASALIRDQNPLERVPTLFIVDACYSGTSILEQLFHLNEDVSIHKWVIAAAGVDESAFDGRLTRAFGTVLDRLRRGELDLAPDIAHITFGALTHLVRQEVNRLAGSGPRQTVRNTPTEIDFPGVFTLFPNPAFVPAQGPTPSRSLSPFLESLAFDATHWRTRAAGTLQGNDAPGAFAGRGPELRQLTAFITEGVGPLALVTGAPGSGKSALLGLIVCNGHPELHEQTHGLWASASGSLPGRQASLLAVHARRLGLQEVVDSLALQLNLSGVEGPQDLLERLAALPEPPIAILDALDEATPSSLSSSARSGISELVDGLILPAVRRVRPDGRPLVRLIIGSRKWVGEASLTEVFGDLGEVVDLDAVPGQRLTDEIALYGRSRLQQSFPRWSRTEIDRVATNLADRLIRASALDFGSHFLCAALWLSGVIDDAPTPRRAATEARSAPVTLPGLLESDLARRSDRELLKSTLHAVALSKGVGAPASVVAGLASGLEYFSEEPSSAEIQQLLRSPLSFYLRTSSDLDGTVLYRLFHQGIADYLLGGTPSSGVAAYITDRVFDAEALELPYFRRHLVEHASDADRWGAPGNLVDHLWGDPNFLGLATPGIARAYPPSADETAVVAWEIYSWSNLNDQMSRKERLSMLATTASRWPNTELRDGLTAAAELRRWQPSWGTMKQRHEQVEASTEHEPTLIFANPIGQFADPIGRARIGLISARASSSDFRVRVLAGTEGLATVFPSGWDGPEVTIDASDDWISAAALSPDGSVMVLADSVGHVLVYSLAGGQVELVGTMSFPHESRICALAVVSESQLAVGFVGGAVVARSGRLHRRLRGPESYVSAITASSDFGRLYVGFARGDVVVWEPTFDVSKRLSVPTGQWVVDEIDGKRPATIQAMALSGDDRLLLTGGNDGYFRRWDAIAGRPLGEPVRASNNALRLVGFGREGRTVVTEDEIGTDRTWDLFTSAQIPRGERLVERASVAFASNRLVHVYGRRTSVYDLANGQDQADDWRYDRMASGKAQEKSALHAAWVTALGDAFATWLPNGDLHRWTRRASPETTTWNAEPYGNLPVAPLAMIEVPGGLLVLDTEGQIWRRSEGGLERLPLSGGTALAAHRGKALVGYESGRVTLVDAESIEVTELAEIGGRAPVTALASRGSDIWVGRDDGSLERGTADDRRDMGKTTRGSRPIDIWRDQDRMLVVRSDGVVQQFDLDGRLVLSTSTGFTPSASAIASNRTLALANAIDVLVFAPA